MLDCTQAASGDGDKAQTDFVREMITYDIMYIVTLPSACSFQLCGVGAWLRQPSASEASCVIQ
eukprot:3430676-Amphidinium_carterae.1